MLRQFRSGDLHRLPRMIWRNAMWTAVSVPSSSAGSRWCEDERIDIALVREARYGLGDGPDLLVDAGLVWDAKTAIRRVRAF